MGSPGYGIYANAALEKFTVFEIARHWPAQDAHAQSPQG